MKEKRNDTEHEVSKEESCTVFFSQEEKQVLLPQGATLLDAAQKADIYVNALLQPAKGPAGNAG